MALIGQAVLEKKMFEYNVYVHVHGLAARSDNPPGSIFPIPMHRRPILALP